MNATIVSARKPKVSPLVPTYALDAYLGRIHVMTPDEEVQATIQRKLDTRTDARWTPAIKRQTLRYALWRHHCNRDLYRRVMGR